MRLASVVARPMNPVLARELRQRMRGRWAPVVITIYLLLLAGVMQLVHTAYVRNSDVGSALDAGGLGRTLFQTLIFFMLLLLCFLVPGLSAAAVAGERERQTLVPIQVTMLKPLSIVTGKLMASLAFVLLLLTATLPLISVSLIIGGVGLPEVFRAMGMLFLTAVLLASIAVATSSVLRRVQAATVVAYGFTFMLLLGTLLGFAAQLVITQKPVREQPQGLLAFNPVFAMADVIGGRDENLSGGSPFEPAQALLRERDGAHEVFDVEQGLQGAGVVGGEARNFVGEPPQFQRQIQQAARNERAIPFWLVSVFCWSLVIAGSLFIASRRLRAPSWAVGS